MRMVEIELKWGQGAENVEGVEAAPISEVGWIKVATMAWDDLMVESWTQQFLSSLTCDTVALRSEGSDPTLGRCHTIPENSWLLKMSVQQREKDRLLQ